MKIPIQLGGGGGSVPITLIPLLIFLFSIFISIFFLHSPKKGRENAL